MSFVSVSLQTTETSCDNVWCFVSAIYNSGGIGVLCFLFIAYIFYSLVWKVWSAAMASKNDEIERLIEERNFLQSQLFPRRLTSDAVNDKKAG